MIIRSVSFRLRIEDYQENDYYLDVLMDPKSQKYFARSWREWLEKAKTDPDAQAQIDRVVKHPEFELYNIKKDPWELDNLANNPEYFQKVEEMHAQLKADMERLNDSFQTADPKKAKREKKGSDKKAARKRARKKEQVRL